MQEPNEASPNPLLAGSGLPRFARIRAEHVEPALDQVLQESERRLQALLDDPAGDSWDRLVWPVQLMLDRLDRLWAPVRHLHSVNDSEALRAAYERCLSKLTDYYTTLGQNRRLYQAYERIAASPDYAGLDQAQRKILDDALRDFRLSGVHLEGRARARFGEIQARLSELSNRFENNLLDATRGWELGLDSPERLAGIADSGLRMLRQQAESRDHSGWLITLDFPVYNLVMSYADDRALRETLYQAWVTRASDAGPNAGRWDNGPLMEEILALRHEKAQLLGYPDYAELSLVTKMARDAEEVEAFLLRLAARARPAAERERDELRLFAREQLAIEELQPWDQAYVAEKLKQRRFAFDDETLKPYLPAPRVLQGLFAVVERLFAVRVQPGGAAETWHPDVQFFEIRDEADHLCGQFYLDLYARAAKRGGAWMDACIGRLREGEKLQTPVAFLTCNLSPPVGDEPALLTHDEVLTLFHEFGHGLHHLLTRIDYPAVAGISGVEWDAVELPSQFLENFVWYRDALDLVAAHYQTDAPLPEELFTALNGSRRFQAGLQMLRQLEFALFDLRLHRDYHAGQGGRIQAVLDAVRAEVAVFETPAYNRFQYSFSHIFAGGYAAGYYSYKWAEVLSADAFDLFERNGILDPAGGRRFRDVILACGGSRPARELFREFRGRDPEEDALLRHNGLLQEVDR